MVRPQARRTWSITSGFSGSPAEFTSRRLTFHWPRSSWISMRHTVGGAQNDGHVVFDQRVERGARLEPAGERDDASRPRSRARKRSTRRASPSRARRC